jgi:hypothetical protein
MHPTVNERPALASLIGAMAKLSRRQRLEVAACGRKAKAAKAARIRRLTSAAAAESRRLKLIEPASR